MTTQSGDGVLLWEPSQELKRQANVTRCMQWLAQEKGLSFHSREELWQWSVDNLEDFWASIAEYFHVKFSRPYTAVLTERKMPGAVWFPGSRLNFAEHFFRNATSERPALVFRSERHELVEVSWSELRQKAGAVARALRTMGVQQGDRVVAYMPNIPETLIAFLACASMGAVWSSCSPDFGTSSVIDRFKQIEPKVLFAVDGYQYNGKGFDRRPIIAELQQSLPTLQKTILVPYLFPDSGPGPESLSNALAWQDLLSVSSELVFEQVPFDHPLWVLYSSGTTGLPKPIVQGQGGILLEHLKNLTLDLDLKPADKFFWFTTTGWMMWNLLTSGLLVGATVLLYNGSPAYPDIGTLWKFAQDSGMTFFGTSAGFITSCMKAGIEPGKTYDLSKLLAIGSTGFYVLPKSFQGVYDHVCPAIWLGSLSGERDVFSTSVGGRIPLPVY